MKTVTLLRNSIHSSLPKYRVPLIPVLLIHLALAQSVQAVSPAPGGDYANGNTALGEDALFSLDVNFSYNNTAIGFEALYNDLSFPNTAVGSRALYSNYEGVENTAIGVDALRFNKNGADNTAIGEEALKSNVSGYDNTAIGAFALNVNISGYDNTAIGSDALKSNTSGGFNTANGFQALLQNTTGNHNMANGFQALFNNTTGTYNTADGVNALYSNTTGIWNVAIGANAGKNLTTGNGNVCIGVNVLGVAGESNTTRIRNVYSSIASGRAVYVNADNKIGTLSSSRRYKEEIKPMDKASETLFALKPVTFRYKKEIDPDSTPQWGLVAEEVDKVHPDLVTRDKQGKPETVRYEAVNAMLLNEFLKEHRKVAEQQTEIDALKAGLQRVSAQLEASRPTLKTVVNNQ